MVIPICVFSRLVLPYRLDAFLLRGELDLEAKHSWDIEFNRERWFGQKVGVLHEKQVRKSATKVGAIQLSFQLPATTRHYCGHHNVSATGAIHQNILFPEVVLQTHGEHGLRFASEQWAHPKFAISVFHIHFVLPAFCEDKPAVNQPVQVRHRFAQIQTGVEILYVGPVHDNVQTGFKVRQGFTQAIEVKVVIDKATVDFASALTTYVSVGWLVGGGAEGRAYKKVLPFSEQNHSIQVCEPDESPSEEEVSSRMFMSAISPSTRTDTVIALAGKVLVCIFSSFPFLLL